MFNARSHYSDDFDPAFEMGTEDFETYKTKHAAHKERHPWSAALSKVYDLCLVHTNTNVPGKVVYYASIENLRSGKTTRTSPEMFYQRWLGQAPQHIQNAWQAEVMGKIMPVVKFVANDQPDEWFRIYEQGPYSCMQGSPLVRQYCHPENNLALAYMEENGKIDCRTIVNKKTMAWVRIFGKKDNNIAFATALRGLGYGHDPDQALHGEAVRLDWADCASCGDNILIGPYLDSDDYRHVKTRNDGTKTGIISDHGDRMHNNEEGDSYYCSESCSESNSDDDEEEY